MPSAKLAVAIGLSALSLSACGTISKPEAGSQAANANSAKSAYDPRAAHLACLKQDGIAIRLDHTMVGGVPLPGMVLGPSGASATVGFEPTVGDAQGVQIQGESQGAEVIGAALLFPENASDGLLSQVEQCLYSGVKG